MNESQEEEINDLIQYKRLVYKLEDELNKKNSENLLLVKLNENLKSLCNSMQNECQELNSKLLNQYSEMKKLNRDHQEEIKNININFEKQKQIYEDKIKQISNNNTPFKKLKMEKEMEMRYEEKIKTKDAQIEILNNKITRLEKDKNDLESEIEDLKMNKVGMLKMEKNENNNLINNINEDNIEVDKNNKILKEFQDIINNKEEKISELIKEINIIKNEQNDYERNISKKYFFNKNELLDEQNKNKLLEAELNKKEKELNNIKEKLTNLQNLVDEKNEHINTLFEEKNKLINECEKLKEQEDINNDYFQKQLDSLKQLIKKNESEYQLNYLTNEKLRKKYEEKNNNKINQLQKELEEEKSKLNIMESNQIKSNNFNDINIKSEEEEEKNQIIKYDKNTNIYKMEYENIKEKYKLLSAENKIYEQKMKKKEEEKEYIQNCLKEMIVKEKERKIYYKELKYKYRNLIKKKENYKDLCKIARKNMENLISLLTPQQKEQIEQSENKYLIDTSSFSFTELY